MSKGDLVALFKHLTLRRVNAGWEKGKGKYVDEIVWVF